MNLTTLANVRGWLGLTTDDDNVLLNRLIGDATRMINNYVQRNDFGLAVVTEITSGRNTPKLPLRNWPVIAATALTIDGVVIPASTGPTSFGYAVEQFYGSIAGKPQMMAMVGSVPSAGGGWPSPYGYYGQSPQLGGNQACRPFTQGINNISATYSYGYAIQKEPQTIPAASTYTVAPNAPYGAYGADNGVTFANGTAMTAMPAGTDLVSGQYIAPVLTGALPTLVYTFAAADAGAAILLNYSYVPFDVEQACIEIVAERYKYRTRIGEQSRSMGGQETASYMTKDALTAAIKARLDVYRLVWSD